MPRLFRFEEQLPPVAANRKGWSDMPSGLLKTRQEGRVLWAEICNPHVNFLTVDILTDLWELVRKVRERLRDRPLSSTG